ncbi:hypothetical protein [Mesorhizobium sp. RIZ17]|uniref:hypothetical protein n=1 Tax=Mesorhizobium sp. RIZ17 TaxID=3132743 RepID=UPI003DA98F3F
MSILSGDPTTQLAFSVFENRGVYALLLGSGLSRAAGIPTGWEITLDLVRRVALAKGVEDQSDWAEWYRKEVGSEANYSALLAELALAPAERRSILHSYIEPDEDDRAEGKKLPTAAHHAIARLVRDGFIKVIVTTNFDRLLENALSVGLRTYPAVLMMTAYGLGLIRAERWKLLHDLFSLQIAREDREPKRVANHLFLWGWKGSGDDVWNNIEGFITKEGHRRTPLSDHLLDVFREWGPWFIGIVPDYDLLFDWFEALGGLAHLEENSEDTLKEQLSLHDNRVHMSTGRIGWRREGHRSIEHDLKSTDKRGIILRAGFAHASETYLDLYLENLRRIAKRMDWH